MEKKIIHICYNIRLFCLVILVSVSRLNFFIIFWMWLTHCHRVDVHTCHGMPRLYSGWYVHIWHCVLVLGPIFWGHVWLCCAHYGDDLIPWQRDPGHYEYNPGERDFVLGTPPAALGQVITALAAAAFLAITQVSELTQCLNTRQNFSIQ